MAEQDQTDIETQPIEEEGVAAGERPKWLSKIRVVVIVVFIVLVECVVAYLYIPSANEARAIAGAALVLDEDENGVPDIEETASEVMANQTEVDLGYFDLTAYQGGSSTTLRIQFQLYGIVNEIDEDEFLDIIEENEHRLRDQILATMRSVNVGDLNDAGLGLIKRRILEKSNKAIGKPLLQAVVFSDFSFIEQ